MRKEPRQLDNGLALLLLSPDFLIFPFPPASPLQIPIQAYNTFYPDTMATQSRLGSLLSHLSPTKSGVAAM